MLGFRVHLRDFKETAKGWSNDNVTLHSSSLAYYTIFSIAPLLVIAMAVAGFFLGERASQGQIFGEVQGLIGAGGASAVQTMVQSAASQPRSGIWATILGTITLGLGASGVFQQLQQSLNQIWNVEAPTGEGIKGWLRRRIFSLAMVGVIAFLLLVSLIASAMISAAGKYLGTSAIWEGFNFVISIGVITLLFASVYKFLPDVKLRWSDLWAGSLLTAILFSIGKWIIGLYLGKSSVSSSYGAAGSIVVLLLWAYYSAMIFFFGAEFVKVVTLRRGYGAQAKPGAEIRNEERAKSSLGAA
jgi:membrane protein